MTQAIVIDPIFRGSRLYYSAMAYNAFSRAGMRPVILTRMEYESADLPVYFDGDHDIKPITELPKGFWYGKIPPEKIRELIDAAALIAVDAHSGLHLHFSGLNEMFPALFDLLRESFENSQTKISFSMIDYDARDLLFDTPHFLKIRERLRDFLSRQRRAHIFFLDDRLQAKNLLDFRAQVSVMPDPAPLEPSAIEGVVRDAVASALFDDDARIRVTAIGRQSDRKGLPDIIGAAHEIGRGGAVRIYVTGPLEPTQENLRESLIEVTPDPVVWRDEYVPEEEIRRTYRDTDYVLLPYDRTFEGSSGVFAYAAAFGKPVISTDHGCIGYRVKHHKLGFVYSSTDHNGLAQILRRLPSRSSESYQSMSRAIADYESDHNIGIFSRRLIEVVERGQSSRREKNLPNDNKTAEDGKSINLVSDGERGFPILQTELERMAHAPKRLDYKQILLFDTSVSSRNLGDQIIMESLRGLLRMIFPKSSFVNVPTHEYTGTEALKLMERSEYVFVCGTNLLASHLDDYKQWKLQGADAFLLSDLTLLGCGWWQYQNPPNPYTRFLYKRILSGSTMHSVRDGYTKGQLAEAGIRNVINTCCPTTWWLTPRHLSRIPTEQRETVVFTFTDYAKDGAADSAIVNLLARKYREVYCWLQGADDYSYAKSVSPNSVKFIAPTLEAYTEFLEATECDYVGTRLHGGVKALQAGRRALILAVDNRAKEIASDVCLPVVTRNSIDDINSRLEQGWDTRIRVPYAEINAWIRQFGHSPEFNLENMIDKLVYGISCD